MAKASIETPNGSKVEIDGTPEEIAAILATLNGRGGAASLTKGTPQPKPKLRRRRKSASTTSDTGAAADKANNDPSMEELIAIANLARTCDEAEGIEKNILDKSNRVNRVLLPLYLVHEYKENKLGLTSGDVSKITSQLSVPLSLSAASTILSGTASRYISGDTVRRSGIPVRYKIVRRGVQYIKNVIAEKAVEPAK